MKFVIKKLYFVNFLDFVWTWTFNLKKKFGLWLDFVLILKIQDWIWIEKCDSPLISAM